ncbi:hypothetical protein Taro_051641 [Colocasia esculenta]|uniref:DUF3475 domain-containing protein n=1 Tax=Colocasia esculenta TaxID=4460 RepID=A0A843XH40_COLES|nr:hypothetical protein [Colocasia esculenta]
MALDWVIKLRSVFSPRVDSVRSMASATRRRKAKVGILAFEAASLMSKLLHLWRSLSDAQVARLRRESIALPGVRRVNLADRLLVFSASSLSSGTTLSLRKFINGVIHVVPMSTIIIFLAAIVEVVNSSINSDGGDSSADDAIFDNSSACSFSDLDYRLVQLWGEFEDAVYCADGSDATTIYATLSDK